MTKPEEIDAAFEKAKEKTDGPTLIEFIIDSEQLVFPMMKTGGSINEMIMGSMIQR